LPRWPRAAAQEFPMNVLAFCSPGRPDWRWRIVDYNGETMEESSMGFATIALAVADGSERLQYRIDRDLAIAPRSSGPISFPRRR
jgi:hypothetical protein